MADRVCSVILIAYMFTFNRIKIALLTRTTRTKMDDTRMPQHVSPSSSNDRTGQTIVRTRSSVGWSFPIIAGCFLVSGFAALLYETVWLRQFAILLGTSEQALAIVLSSYLGGLAIGALVASRWVGSIRRPLLTYGVLELGIAISALLVPVGITVARSLQVQALGGLPEPPPAGTASQMIFSLSVGIGLILVPTSLMGATLPLLARHVVHRDDQLGPRIGLLYAINTVGAVLGTIVAAFVLMPSVGMGATTWVGAASNLLVFALVLMLVRSGGISEEGLSTHEIKQQLPSSTGGHESHRRGAKPKKSKRKTSRDSTKVEVGRAGNYQSVLWLIGLSGVVSFCYEIIFTRMLSHSLGGSVFAFATMLSGFLLGIALGGAIASRIATTRRVAALGFVYAQAAAAVCTVFAYGGVNACAKWTSLQAIGATTTSAQIIVSIMILLPSATCIGSAFPFAIRAFAKDESEAAIAAAKVYSWSTVGGILGSLLAGAVLLPQLQYHGSVTFAILGNLSIAVLAVMRFQLPRIQFAAPLIGLGILLIALPKAPEYVLRASALGGQTDGEIVFQEVGQSATVSVFSDRGALRFQTNGLPEASLKRLGMAQEWQSGQRWLSVLPPALREEMDSMMIIGLGGGVAVSAVPQSVGEIDVVELSASVINANRAIGNLRNDDPLRDERVNVIVNDARNALALTDRKYDCIVSQPSHPWTAGSSHLYTREFAELIKEHLEPGGIFLQWMGTSFIDEALLGNMCATLLEPFEYVRIYQPFPGAIFFTASDQPIHPESMERLPIPPGDQSEYYRYGLNSPQNLLACLAADQISVQQLAEGREVIRDDRNLVAMRAPGLIQRSTANENANKVKQALAKVSPLGRGKDEILRLCPTVDLFLLGNRLIDIGFPERTEKHLVDLIEDAEPKELLAQLARRARGGTGTATWSDYLESRQDTSDPRLAYLILYEDAVKRISPLSPTSRERLESVASERHVRLLKVVRSLQDNDWEPGRTEDSFLASFPPEDLAFETSILLRIPWRLETTSGNRGQRYIEILQMIDQNAAFTTFLNLAYFRAVAAVRVGQSVTALATASEVADLMIREASENRGKLGVSSQNTLNRFSLLLSDASAFPNASEQRYRDAFRQVQVALELAK